MGSSRILGKNLEPQNEKSELLLPEINVKFISSSFVSEEELGKFLKKRDARLEEVDTEYRERRDAILEQHTLVSHELARLQA